MIKLEKTHILNKNNQTFKGALTGKTVTKIADLFIQSQENLSSTRFIQDTATNWAPKAIFARSKADFAEMSFLEFIESAIFYFASPILGEKVFRKNIFNKLQPKNLRKVVDEQIPNTLEAISKNTKLTDEVKKRAISTKAGIVLASTVIPVAEYTLSFAKNLFTLKKFKKSNFNNIANLDKSHNEKEDPNQQKKVEESSIKHLKKAGIISGIAALLGIGLAAFGHKSNTLQKISEGILEPGQKIADNLDKIGVKSEKIKKGIGKISFDFGSENGKLSLSKGQLGLTALVGLFGYSKAAHDRGKLDVLEVWTRVPLVVAYTIFGAELFEKGFSKILKNKDKFKDIIQTNAEGKITTPLRKDLPELAKKIAKEKGADEIKELSRLTKEKAFIQAVPYAFSLLFMGLTLSGITRLWTQYRYNHQEKNQKTETNQNNDTLNFLLKRNSKIPQTFGKFTSLK